MRSAQSRLGLVTSLGAASRGVTRCVDALPVPVKALKFGAAAIAGLAGVSLLRVLMPSRRAEKAKLAALPAAEPRRHVGRYLLSETVLTLLLPLCRRYFLGESSPGASSLGNVVDRLLKNGR